MNIIFKNGSEIKTIEAKNDSKKDCIRLRRLTDKEYKEMIFREQVQAEERVDRIIKELNL